MRYLAVLLCVLLAITLHWARPHVAVAYNNWGARLHRDGRLTEAINKYQRALGLDANYAAAHFNIATAYEDSFDYEKAISEYKLAILADNKLYTSYNNLARIYIVQGKEYAAAVKLIDTGLTLEINLPTQSEVNYIKSKMYKNRGWANLELKNYEQAKLDLITSIEFNGENAEAYCVLASVLEAQKDNEQSLESWLTCKEMSATQKDDIDARWLSLINEKVKSEE